MNERLITLLKYKASNEKNFIKEGSEKTGIKKETLRALCNKGQKFNNEHIEAIASAFPEYKHWLVFGEELPESGQISPMTKKTTSDYQTQGKAG
jgi:hypothetical protein